MKRDVRIRPGAAKEAGLKPDVTIVVSDKVCACIRVPGRRAQDMVALALGKLNPQKAFLQGKIRVSPIHSRLTEMLQVKGNLMKGLSMNTVLNQEVGKLSKL